MLPSSAVPVVDIYLRPPANGLVSWQLPWNGKNHMQLCITSFSCHGERKLKDDYAYGEVSLEFILGVSVTVLMLSEESRKIF